MPPPQCEPRACRAGNASCSGNVQVSRAWWCRFGSLVVKELLDLRPFNYDVSIWADLLLSSMQISGVQGTGHLAASNASEKPVAHSDSNRSILHAVAGSCAEFCPGMWVRRDTVVCTTAYV